MIASGIEISAELMTYIIVTLFIVLSLSKNSYKVKNMKILAICSLALCAICSVMAVYYTGQGASKVKINCFIFTTVVWASLFISYTIAVEKKESKENDKV